MPRKPAASPLPSIAGNRVVHETPWVCWPLRGGCGLVLGLNFGGGACPGCGEYAVSRIVVRDPAEVRP